MITTITILASLAAQTAEAPTAHEPAEQPVLTVELIPLPLEQQTALRCSVAIAIATERQRSGGDVPADWPDLLENNRGQEFFVRSLAKLMDDTGLPRDGLAAYGRKEAEAFKAEPEALEAIMPACLALLEASGL